MFDAKILYVSTPSNGFIIFAKHFYGIHAFSNLELKQDRPDLCYKEVDESVSNLNNFIKDADVIKKESTATLAKVGQNNTTEPTRTLVLDKDRENSSIWVADRHI